MVKAIAVGKTPRYARPSVADIGAACSSDTSWPVKGRQQTVPTMMPNQVAWAAGIFRSTGFWMITLTAASTAARRQSSTPATSAVERSPEAGPEPNAISATPPKATRLPMISQRGKPSLRNKPAMMATRMGLTLISRAAVPASRRCSAAFNATLYPPNHITP